MRKIILLFALDLIISGGVAAWLYFARGVDAAIFAGLSIFIACSPICFALAERFALYLTRRKLSELGVTLNNPDALKILAEANVVALPFNRVLTCGECFITDLVPQMMSQSALLTMAASAERSAHNLLGRTIYDAAIARSLQLQPAKNFSELPGRGVEAMVGGTLIRVGSAGWLDGLGTSINTILRTRTDQLLVKGKAVLIVATGKVARGLIALKDDLSIDARKFLGELHRKKIETLLLTAQPKKLVNRIAKEFLLDTVRTNLTPEGKAREVQIFRAKGNIVAAIGNDVQDLLALTAADVSILLAGGTLKYSEETRLDIEISTLGNFLTVRELALKFVGVVKINRRMAFLSWLILIPPALTTALESPLIPFHPLIALAGVAIFAALILANSLRMK